MTGTWNPDPSSGPKNDIQIWKQMVEAMLGPGCVADEVRTCEVETERATITSGEEAKGKYQKAQVAALRAWLMIEGICNVVEKQQRDRNPDLVEETVAPWRELNQRARIVLHFLERLPQMMKEWRAQKQQG
jgi:hypothetical protein